VNRRTALFGLLVLSLSAGCNAAPVAGPEEGDPTVTVPTVTAPSPAVQVAQKAKLPTLARDSLARQAKRLTLRVRNIECTGYALGSGFGLTPGLLITNRHVVAEALALEVNTWDGHSLNVDGAAVGVLGDLGVVRVQGKLPEVAVFGPKPERGDSVMAVGYPLGGPLTLARGVIVGKVFDPALGVDVLRLTARIEHGNSGGPLLDDRGRVIGVIYAKENRTGYGLAIPVQTMLKLVEIGGLTDVPPCGAN
jgi:S1-C subfamily serine protease